MKTIPKELTPELLSLVLNTEVSALIGEDNFNCLHFKGKVAGRDMVNIDTLTRLMKEFCLKQGYSIDIEYMNNEDDGDWFICMVKRYTDKANYLDKQFYNEPSEFEAVLKATHWVMKEKGLL